jgi:hypothetical protein
MLRSDLINRIIEVDDLKNPQYLEIGVHHGVTFSRINSSNKDGVDPGQYCDCPLVNYKITSDDFFANHINKKYDIVFIDGLHTAFQVSKDIHNTIKNINNGGWIIIDDVFPHNEYEQESLNLKKSGAQTGDVWKAVYNVLDELINMSEKIYFEPRTERGNLVIKLKDSNQKNISIDGSIPTCNVDGWYVGDDAEWSKYTYKNDFQRYITIMNNFPKL